MRPETPNQCAAANFESGTGIAHRTTDQMPGFARLVASSVAKAEEDKELGAFGLIRAA